MTSEELYDKLAGYIGLRVKISSDVTSSGLWRESYPELVEVVIRNSDQAVCCKTSDGVWSIVIEEGLKLEVEPPIGTADFATPVKQMQLIGETLIAYREMPDTPKPIPPPPNRPERGKRMDWTDW